MIFPKKSNLIIIGVSFVLLVLAYLCVMGNINSQCKAGVFQTGGGEPFTLMCVTPAWVYKTAIAGLLFSVILYVFTNQTLYKTYVRGHSKRRHVIHSIATILSILVIMFCILYSAIIAANYIENTSLM